MDLVGEKWKLEKTTHLSHIMFGFFPKFGRESMLRNWERAILNPLLRSYHFPPANKNLIKNQQKSVFKLFGTQKTCTTLDSIICILLLHLLQIHTNVLYFFTCVCSL